MTKTAVIIAPDDSGSQAVFGVPNIRRLVLLASKLGCETIHLFGRTGFFAPILSDLLPPTAFHPVTDSAQLQQAIERALPDGEQRVLALKADVVIDRLTLAEFLERGEEATILHLQLADDGSADGIYLAPAGELSAIADSLWSPARANSALRQAAKHLPGRDGLPCTVGQNVEDVKACEARLIDVLAAQTAKGDGFMARHFDRRVSRFFSSRLVHTNLKPNHVTLMGVTIGLTAALLLSLPGYWPHLVGSLLFVFCVIVDGVDGEIARLKLMDSRFGHYLDITTDNLVHVAIFIGIGLGLYHETGSRLYIWALWFLLGGFGVCALAVYRCILSVDAATLKESPRMLRLMEMVSNRDFAYLVALLALIGRLDWFFLGASIGTYLFAASLWYLSSRERQKHAALAQESPH